MAKTSVIVALCAVLVLVVIVLFLQHGGTQGLFTGTAGPATLAATEVRSYEGMDLSSIGAFHENSIRGSQQVDITDYRLMVTGLVRSPKSYTYHEVLSRFPHYRKVVTLYCVEGWDATILWDGIKVSDIIDDAGADPRADTVIFTARDGYTTSLPLAYIRDNEILMAYGMNNVTLPAERGFPFQLVAEDKWGYKWIKWVEQIELSDNAVYKGYWEERGYSNTADLNGSFYGR